MFKLFSKKWEREEPPCPDSLTGIHKVRIKEFLEDNETVTLSAEQLDEFRQYLHKGRCQEMLKCITPYIAEIEHDAGVSEYFIHVSSFGPEPGGLRQVIFIPKKKGLRDFLDALFANDEAG